MEELISVIIPVLNAQDTIRDCLSSIQTQTYKNLEILVVDGGSSDQTVSLCQKAKQQDPRIHFFENEGQSIGNSRNCGLMAAKGNYVVFSDADDKLYDTQVIEEMHQKIQAAEADILVGNYVRFMDGQIVLTKPHGWDENTDVSTRNFRFCGFFSDGHLAYVWAKMYRRAFLLEHAVLFSDIRYAEDKLFNFECYAMKAVYSFMDKPCYIYSKNEHSVSHQYHETGFDDWVQMAMTYTAFLQSRGAPKEYRDLAAYTLLFSVFFEAKQEYIHFNDKQKVRDVLAAYYTNKEAGAYIKQVARGEYLEGIHSRRWRMMMHLFAAMLTHGFLAILQTGILMLLHFSIDQKLSSTGKQKKSE